MAEALHISQPTLTKQVNALEDDLGVRLLDRDTSRASLTNEGHAFLRHAIGTPQDMRELEGMFRNRTSVVFNYLHQHGAAEVGKQFRQRRPNAAINMLRLKIWGDTPCDHQAAGQLGHRATSTNRAFAWKTYSAASASSAATTSTRPSR